MRGTRSGQRRKRTLPCKASREGGRKGAREGAWVSDSCPWEEKREGEGGREGLTFGGREGGGGRHAVRGGRD